ncbi:MAG: ABC transporter substrate-binding protein, partial [Treponema sp.]|nr:ABC transporter substrate-binding protein [Treponema sp.]
MNSRGEPRLATCKWPSVAAGAGIVFFILIFLFSCTPKQESSSRIIKEDETNFIIDALGRPYKKSDKPERIVSLVPAATEILFAIGAGEQVVGVTQYCDYPEEAKSRTSVGGFSGASMSLEIIRDLAPDLVVLSADMHGRIILLLDELGIPSFAVEPGNFLEVYNVISTLGEICG